MTAPTAVEVPDFASIPDNDDPFAVIYVVNDSRDDEGNIAAEKDILQASSDALHRLLNDTNEEVTKRLSEWTSGRIRKIVKRARGAAWNKLIPLDVPHFHAESNGAEVLVFAPMRISEQPKEIKRLQVTGLNSNDYSSNEFSTEQGYLLVAVNDSLNMSTGKVVAQVGHAVQLFLMYGNEVEIENWADNGWPLKVVRAENLSEDTATGIVVHDAGFTEVPSGSLTATANYRFKLEGK
jgi:peptidyl-tRNA hydrolase